jgi:hypothetical protein
MSDDKKDKSQEAADFMVELMRAQGVAVSTMRDGTILFFKRSYLQELLDSHPGKEELVLFIKRPDFQN